jgi:hypothetical protein
MDPVSIGSIGRAGGGKLLSITSKFFPDYRKLGKSLADAEKSVLSRIGAFIRTAAMRSIRPAGKKGKVSEPGQPPRSRTGLLKKFIFFIYESAKKSVIIGPAALNITTRSDSGRTLRGRVPEILEYGGSYDQKEFRRPQNLWLWKFAANKYGVDYDADRDWARYDNRLMSWRYDGAEIRTRTITIAPRPYMKPAYDAEMPKFQGMWRDALNKASGG